MPNERETKPRGEVRELLEGILADVQMLIQQQLAIFRSDVNREIEQARGAAALAIVGVAIVMTGGILFSLMLVHLLVVLFPTLPLWASFGIIGTPIIAIGCAVCFAGSRKFSAEAVEEEAGVLSVLTLKETSDD